MRTRLVMLSSALASACTSTTAVTPAALQPLRAPVPGQAAVLQAQGGGRVRLDANSKIRFGLADGQRTPWISVSKLRTSDDGLFIQRTLKLSQVHGLEGADVLDEDLDRLRLPRAARPHAIYVPGPNVKAALRRLMSGPGTPSGRWRAKLADGSWTGWMQGPALADAHQHGLRLESGVLWAHIAKAEVRNFSGGKTLGLIVGGAAIIATLAALGGGNKALKTHPSAAHIVAHSAARTLYFTSLVLNNPRYTPRVSAIRSEGQDSLQEATSGSTALFSGLTRRRANIEVVPSLQSLATLSAPEGLEQTASLSLRLRKVWELGGGMRAAGLAAPQGPTELRFVGFARAGLHLNLDADHRFAVPLSIDAGAGQGVLLQMRLNLGLRIRVTERFTLGLSAPSPTLTTMRGADPKKVQSRWSFPAGIELSFAL